MTIDTMRSVQRCNTWAWLTKTTTSSNVPRRSCSRCTEKYFGNYATGVCTENAPAGDYAEFLVASALGGTLAPNSEKSFDVLVGDLRVQVKARVVSDPPKSGHLQLSPFRSFDFDEAIIVLFDDLSYGVRKAVRVPVDIV